MCPRPFCGFLEVGLGRLTGMLGGRGIPSGVFHFVNDCFESCGVVEREVGEDFAVDFDACLVDKSHELGVGQVFETGSCVDTLNPKCAEVAFFVFAVTIGVGETFFPGVFGNGPHVTAAAEVAACEFEDFFTTCARSNVVN